jgi:hypothetical protein
MQSALRGDGREVGSEARGQNWRDFFLPPEWERVKRTDGL